MTWADRLAHYAAAFPERRADSMTVGAERPQPGSELPEDGWDTTLWMTQERGLPVAYGVWVIGNDYSNPSEYYGAYPRGYLPRVHALFPDVCQSDPVFGTDVLHAFSGSLEESRLYDRCDLLQPSEYRCDVTALPAEVRRRRLATGTRGSGYALVIADPPYSKADAEKYGTPMVSRRHCMAALAEVTPAGGHLAWLDVAWPQHRKADWRTAARIYVQRSTNHRVRVLSIFERQGAQQEQAT